MTEYNHQKAVFEWSQQPSVRSVYPELKLLFHIKNETTGGAKQVAIDRKNGIRKGVPDLCLPVPRGGFHGLYIEMKNETGRASEEQKWWGNELENQGYKFNICYGWKQATEVLEWYLNLKEPA